MAEIVSIPLADGVPAWSLLLTGVAAFVGALVGPWGEGIARKEGLKSYKRNIYRNFLDHGYWYLHGDPADAKERKKRAVAYVADWHRIQLITSDKTIQNLTNGIQKPDDFNDAIAEELLKAFKHEIGTGGLHEPK